MKNHSRRLVKLVGNMYKVLFSYGWREVVGGGASEDVSLEWHYDFGEQIY